MWGVGLPTSVQMNLEGESEVPSQIFRTKFLGGVRAYTCIRTLTGPSTPVRRETGPLSYGNKGRVSLFAFFLLYTGSRRT